MMRSPEELALGWRDALVGRDAGAFGRLFAPDAVFIDVDHRTDDLSSARPVVGREAIEAMARRWLEETPAFEWGLGRV